MKEIKVMLSREQIAEKVDELAARINRDYGGLKAPVYVVGMLNGAFVFMADLIRKLDFEVITDFMLVSSYGDAKESSGKVTIRRDIGDIGGCHVLLVEDIIDSGLTMSFVREYLKKRLPASLKLCALLSKPSRRCARVGIDYLGFEIPDEFVVGYGLDCAGRYRSLPYIGVLEP